jgi:replication-associated recombination protein RarA
LPHIESGLITLIGATTENPSFELNSALLSRLSVYVLEPLKADELAQILQRALTHENLTTLDKPTQDSVINASQSPASMGAYHATDVIAQRTHLIFVALNSQPKVLIKIS